jgi:ethanolamine permease
VSKKPEGDHAGVHYAKVEDAYFEKRGLRRYARVWSLWALGVGAVISGDFFGWNFGLAAGGFGGMLAATAIITVMYVGLCFSLAEMSPALPHTGGAYSFARTAMGPWGAFVTGLAENLEYILTPAVIVVGVGSYLGSVFGTPDAYAPLYWLGTYALFLVLNIAGVETSFRVTVVVTALALGILAVFYIGAFAHFDLSRALDIEPSPGQSAWLPRGALGIAAALPFAMWFYLGIEELPLAAEESHDVSRDMPRGILLGLLTLVCCAFLTLVTNTAMAPGATAIAASEEPLSLGLQTIFGAGIGAKLLALVAVAGLVASFHGITFAYGRQIYSLSRAGYFPRVLSVTHPKRKTPYTALLAGAALGFGAALTVWLLGSARSAGAVLLNMTVFGAVISYVLQMASYILLRIKHPTLPRPYKSPLGVPGAVVALLIALATLVSLFAGEPAFRIAVLFAALWYGAGLAYFALYARHHLVYAPEEAIAEKERVIEERPLE